MKITIVAGARPNFIKIAPLVAEIMKRKKEGEAISYRLVHTGQHYDKVMSGQFFIDLQIPSPDINLNCGGGTQAEQTAQILVAFEKELAQNPTDIVIVVGDVNSTLACSITTKKMNLPLAHIEAGIRSGDMGMPEEINRIVTDSLSDYLFTTSTTANNNLYHMGKKEEQVFFVGNIMIDSLLKFMPSFKKPTLFDDNQLTHKSYLVLTLHRPSNVDQAQALRELLQFISRCAKNIPILFPIHPRTQQFLSEAELPENIITTPPLGYLEFNYLIQNSLGVLTDSGGITEETTIMNIPCITLRNSTERPETITVGTNVLSGNDHDKIRYYLDKMIHGKWHSGSAPQLWDGQTAERIVDQLLRL